MVMWLAILIYNRVSESRKGSRKKDEVKENWILKGIIVLEQFNAQAENKSKISINEPWYGNKEKERKKERDRAGRISNENVQK